MKDTSETKRSKENRRKPAEDTDAPRYVLRLYVTGTTQRSTQAILNIRKICEKHLKGRYELEVVDIYQQPVLAAGEQIIAAPTLIKKLPLPLRRFIGDMSMTDRILVGLDLVGKSEDQDDPEPAKEE
ncbi:thiol-disulfide isomerase [bacterium]|nr:MAG: thiol-disulfide isomerase [bacterium]